MFKGQCLFLCLCFFVVGSFGSGNLVPFIDKCAWDDKACLVASTTKAIPYFAKGLPAFGIPSMDPMHMNEVNLAEGELKVDFTGMVVNGASNCKILKVERENSRNLLRLDAECQFDVTGEYEASGKLFVAPVEGKGPFHVHCKLLFISFEFELGSVTGADGVKYWSVVNSKHSYDPREKTTFHFENLFNGNGDKAAPILAIFNESWKDIMLSVAKPIVDEVLTEIVDIFKTFCAKVPADQLEL